jgi:hypothetical protein
MDDAKTLICVDFLYEHPYAEGITASQHPVTNGIFSHGTGRAYLWAGDSLA